MVNTGRLTKGDYLLILLNNLCPVAMGNYEMVNVWKVLWERRTSKYIKLKSNIKNYVENTIKTFLLETSSSIVKTRTFSSYQEAKLPYKNKKAALLIASHKKQQLLQLQIWKKIYFAVL